MSNIRIFLRRKDNAPVDGLDAIAVVGASGMLEALAISKDAVYRADVGVGCVVLNYNSEYFKPVNRSKILEDLRRAGYVEIKRG